MITFPSADENVYGKFTTIGIDKGKYKYFFCLPAKLFIDVIVVVDGSKSLDVVISRWYPAHVNQGIVVTSLGFIV